MRPDEYEACVASYFEERGYQTVVSPYTNDYGVDVFAEKGEEKIAIQAKMYGGTSRRINRQMVMELHGAKDYFDCDSAVIATDGEVLADAHEVATKLKIEIIHVPATKCSRNRPELKENNFELIWQKQVMPLEGRTLSRDNGSSNKIVKVDWSGIERITSNGRSQFIKIEIFEQTINHLLKHGTITRAFINNEYKERASSGIILILSNTNEFELVRRPAGLRLKKANPVV